MILSLGILAPRHVLIFNKDPELPRNSLYLYYELYY